MKPIKVLALQSYFGGSHSQFHTGLVAHSIHDWTTLSLPARHWKWRMRHSGIYFAEEVRARYAKGERWDVVFCTDMLNLAEFKGIAGREIYHLPSVTYFHENQFAYPNRFGKERDRHFSFTNFISALAADEVWFNSQFNLDSLVDALTVQIKKWPDFQPTSGIRSLKPKSKIQPPGIDQPPIDLQRYAQTRTTRRGNGAPIHLIWAARWEHDKNPDDLLKALEILAQQQVSFRLSVIGQSFRTVPPVFAEIKSRFSESIVRWGYQESREEYWRALAEGDIFISTAIHEFFGLSAAEAISVGLHPLLPNRVAYPELLSYAFDENEIGCCLYDGTAEGLADRISQFNQDRSVINYENAATKIQSNITWGARAEAIDHALLALSERCRDA